MPTKIAPEEVRALALDARRLVTARPSVLEEEKQSPRTQRSARARRSVHEAIIEGRPPLENEANMDDGRFQFKLSRREAKRRLNIQQVKMKTGLLETRRLH
jgi:hypothetical protein